MSAVWTASPEVEGGGVELDSGLGGTAGLPQGWLFLEVAARSHRLPSRLVRDGSPSPLLHRDVPVATPQSPLPALAAEVGQS